MRKKPDGAVRHEAFRVLHAAGWHDNRIALAFGLNPSTLYLWRKAENLSRVECGAIKSPIARALHAQGASDGQIAKELGVTPSGVLRWRQRNNLPPNFPYTGNTIEEGERKKARAMLRMGASASKVADYLGCTKNTVLKMRPGVRGGALRPQGITDEMVRKAVLRQDRNIQHRIDRAIGSNLPPHIRAEANSDLFVDVLDGLIAVEMIEDAAPSYRSRAYDMCGSKFGARSMDEEIGEDWTLGDMLDDPDALEQMEEAAAQAFENDNW